MGMFIMSVLGGSALMGEDQQIDLEGTMNGNSQPTNINELDLSISEKLARNCCSMCARHHTATRQNKRGIRIIQNPKTYIS